MRNYTEELAEARRALTDCAKNYQEKAMACADARSQYVQAKANAKRVYRDYNRLRDTVRGLVALVNDPLGLGDSDPFQGVE